MVSEPLIKVEDVRLLARIAQLPLDPERESRVANLLSAWLPDANALSAKMSAPEFREGLPITLFTHPGLREEGQ
ncbi:MAG: hypothetical protein QOJ80_6330 [Mycobacterium sp.]|jgi:hypothetical protein|nr:hypothetical protein [Mycobacterium sp.]